jgi:hypothetical protein
MTKRPRDVVVSWRLRYFRFHTANFGTAIKSSEIWRRLHWQSICNYLPITQDLNLHQQPCGIHWQSISNYLPITQDLNLHQQPCEIHWQSISNYLPITQDLNLHQQPVRFIGSLLVTTCQSHKTWIFNNPVWFIGSQLATTCQSHKTWIFINNPVRFIGSQLLTHRSCGKAEPSQWRTQRALWLQNKSPTKCYG